MVALSRHRPTIAVLSAPRYRADALALGALSLFVATLGWDLAAGGTRIGLDSAVFFYPIFGLLGDRLASGDLLPGWNPHQFAGAPLLADPQSGWGYLPAMLVFTVFPLTTAAPAFALLHVLMAAFGLYALSRVLGVGPLGALVAGSAFAGSGFVRDRSVCCFAHMMVAVWIPPMLIGIELALRAKSWSARIGWWALGGFSISQIFAGWLGQGAVYALLLLGLWAVVRTMIVPARERSRSWNGRASDLVLHGAAVLGLGFGLAAMTLLPRLEFNRLSSLDGGYSGVEATVGGLVQLRGDADRLLHPGGWYAGAAALALALTAPLLARRYWQTWLLSACAALALVLSFRQTTPLHALLYQILPGFERLHRHYPERLLLILYLSIALLAGVAIDALRGRGSRAPIAALLPAAAFAAALGFDATVPAWAKLLAIVTIVVVALAAVPIAPLRSAIPIALALVVVVDGFGSGPKAVDKFPRVDLADYYLPTESARFLAGQTAAEPSRYFGYAPQIILSDQWVPAPYRFLFADPATANLVVNNRATSTGLEDVQGYNPVRLQRFVELFDRANQQSQEYREANVLPGGIHSPLLDLLNTRYIVVSGEQPTPLELAGLPVVFDNGAARILERPNPLPRAWLVHEARQATDEETRTALLAGAFDPRTVALVPGPPPALQPPANPANDRVTIVDHAADEIRITTESDSASLLLMSEIVYPAWEATVDGEPVEILTADGLIRAIAVPAGSHTIVARFDSSSLKLGLAITATTLLGIVLGAGLATYHQRRHRRARSRIARRGPAW